MADNRFAELDIRLDRGPDDSYVVELQLVDPANATVDTIPHDIFATFDTAALKLLYDNRDLATYGKELMTALLADKDAYALFDRARGLDDSLRIVLHLRPAAAKLHDLCWESMCDPSTGARLLETDRVLFSRFLASSDTRKVRPRSTREVRALVVAADPAPSTKYPLDPLPPNAVDEARAALEGIALVDPLDGHATMAALADRLAADPVDVLYLICHGARQGDETMLFLESDAGDVALVSGRVFVDRIKGLVDPPSIVVFAACESAAPGSAQTVAGAGATASVGPLLLSESRVAAVIAMQDTVKQETAGSFVKAFFNGLCRHGHVDLAANEARDAIRERKDWWIPVLYSRLDSGKIWYTPGFAQATERESQKLWNSILANLDTEEKAITPILGNELLNGVIGPVPELARGVLASFLGTRDDVPRATGSRAGVEEHLPIDSEIADDLVQVTQFLSVLEEETVVRGYLREALRSQIRSRFPAETENASSDVDLLGLFKIAGESMLGRDGFYPFRTLAALPFCFYVTTTPETLLEDALRAMTPPREPTVHIFNWRGDAPSSEAPAVFAYDDRKPGQPLICYLLGRLDQADSLVLTEDNYLAFHVALAGSRARIATGTDPSVSVNATNRNVIPPALMRALSVDALMFIGFRLEDWAFRVLFRSIVALQQSDLRDMQKRPLIAVQLAPDERKFRNPEMAQEYLRRYFGKKENIHVYWGTASEFLQELEQQVEKRRR